MDATVFDDANCPVVTISPTGTGPDVRTELVIDHFDQWRNPVHAGPVLYTITRAGHAEAA